MTKKTFFTPGPSAMYPTFEAHLKQALEENIPSISHRSNKFRSIYQDTFENIKNLFNLPDGYAVLFTGSANEIWERLLQNCVEEVSFHLVNGSFSKKFFDFGKQLGKNPVKQEAVFGEGFELDEIDVHYKAELIGLTHNETSSGVRMPEDIIHQVKARHPNRLVSVDMVSSAPCLHLDFKIIDTAYFSVQKAFGLPAGLGVWLANEKCLSKAELLESKGIHTGTYHRLTNLWANFERFETPETPNVLGIYLLGKVAADMLNTGIEKIKKESEEKANVLYQYIEKSEKYEVFVKKPEHRSQTVVIANTQKPSSEIIAKLAEKDVIVGSGYGDLKASQIRIANFPAVSMEDVQELIKYLDEI